MSYASKHLIPDEKLLYETRLSWVVFLAGHRPNINTARHRRIPRLHLRSRRHGQHERNRRRAHRRSRARLGIGLTKRNATEMAVTNKRVLIKQGVFGRRTLEILLQKIESIAVEESMQDACSATAP